ncbi:MAG: M20/M25/M40 family metallo-hydrolase [Proteobacteria bacterium]|nr:M20/M25/M40 family metallo-hydrolase [Pseudomonadota bacterium]MBU0974024.1 M20/M25/M40 family metallo-hydrolase [Pseudomonadota bacterium]
MPGSSYTGPLPPLSEQEQHTAGLLEKHVHILANEIGPRNIWRRSSMDSTVSYLDKILSDMGYTIQRQEFSSHEVTSTNLEVEIPGHLYPEEIIVVGAHYDTVSNCPGANDNGSGVAALLELARLLADANPQRTVRLVAFANEEPPFFFSNTMGSAFYAARCHDRKEKIMGMLSLETIGYYSDEPGSQQYPFPFSIFYPDTASFIGFVGNIRSRQLVRATIKAFRSHARFPSEGLAAPSFITGVGWSDHLSFWRKGYPAIMVTDTAFNRYASYHTPEDTAEKLDYERMSRVVTGLVPTILELANQ